MIYDMANFALVSFWSCSAMFKVCIWSKHISDNSPRQLWPSIDGCTNRNRYFRFHNIDKNNISSCRSEKNVLSTSKDKPNIHNASNPRQILPLRPINPQTNPDPHPPTQHQRIPRPRHALRPPTRRHPPRPRNPPERPRQKRKRPPTLRPGL